MSIIDRINSYIDGKKTINEEQQTKLDPKTIEKVSEAVSASLDNEKYYKAVYDILVEDGLDAEQVTDLISLLKTKLVGLVSQELTEYVVGEEKKQ